MLNNTYTMFQFSKWCILNLMYYWNRIKTCNSRSFQTEMERYMAILGRPKEYLCGCEFFWKGYEELVCSIMKRMSADQFVGSSPAYILTHIIQNPFRNT